jgi:hypothetical protein
VWSEDDDDDDDDPSARVMMTQGGVIQGHRCSRPNPNLGCFVSTEKTVFKK